MAVARIVPDTQVPPCIHSMQGFLGVVGGLLALPETDTHNVIDNLTFIAFQLSSGLLE